MDSGQLIKIGVFLAILVFFLRRIIIKKSRQKDDLRTGVFPKFSPQESVGKHNVETTFGAGTHKNSSKSARSTLILALAFTAAGLVAVGFGIYYLRQGLESRNWLETDGVMNASFVERQTHRASDSRTTSRDKYVARISYRYMVDGRHYTGHIIGFGKSIYSSYQKSDTEKYLEQYPVGKKVAVYYDPKNHGTAVLITGITGGAMLILVVGAIFFGTGVSVFFIWRNNRRKRDAQNFHPIEPGI